MVHLFIHPKEAGQCHGLDGRTSMSSKSPVPRPKGRAPATPNLSMMRSKSHCVSSMDAHDARRNRQLVTNGLLRSKLIISGHASNIIELGHFTVQLRGAINRCRGFVFFNGERGYYRQRGGLEERSRGSVIAMVGGAAAITFRRTSWLEGQNANYDARVFDDRYSIRRLAI